MTGRDGVYVRVARLWLALTLLAVAANALALAVHAARSPTPQGAPGLEEALRRAVPELDAAALARETPREFIHEFFTQFRERPATGRYVNVDAAGFRRTSAAHPWPPAAGHRNVFLFGGSTVFGYGVTDDQTLAAALETHLARGTTGEPTRVYNFGRGGYFSLQQRVLFEQLVAGDARPELAIFVDGVDEFLFADGRPALTEQLERSAWRQRTRGLRLGDLPVLKLLGGSATATPPLGLPVPVSAPQDPDLAAMVVERYVRNRDLTKHEAAAVGVRTLFVWEPSGGRSTHLTTEGYRRLAAFPPERGFVWCADERPSPGETGYIDNVHYAPAMIERLAACIAAAVARDGN